MGGKETHSEKLYSTSPLSDINRLMK